MKKWLTLSVMLFSSVVVMTPDALANNEKYPEFLTYLLSLNSDMSIGEQKRSEETLRTRLIKSKGLSFGLQAGKYWASQEIMAYLKSKDALLNKTYDARPLVVPYKGFLIMPPVIDELDGKTVYKANGSQIRTAEQLYQIRTNPRFITKIPTWKDYIKFVVKNPSIKYVNVLPSADNKEEIAVWQQAVLDGWLQGVEQAKRMATSQIAMLTADVQGLVRYHLLSDRNMIEQLEVSEQFNEVVGGGTTMSINDVIINIKTNPTLLTNRFEWKAIPQLPPIQSIFPNGVVMNTTELEMK
ncbi:type IV secretory system conjugative DNA transfer family protein [Shewanella aestuarii]|uniref:Type IV secretion system DotC family protein n=1 Tax=Shewanella aestuarii TaxID=1028752 RepID=A0A6G9QPL1_9GAMM|nr:type IV secretory system conjugative DNA transfer family protein [Shewanella aestuarii]QIR16530.1 type IV secretion system DotC family protein [Shewanella aestuarii]